MCGLLAAFLTVVRIVGTMKSGCLEGVIPVFAVVRVGGKQVTVSPGDRFVTETLPEDVSELSDVLSLQEGGALHVGRPVVEGAVVKVKRVRAVRGRKVLIFKKNRRHNYRRLNGHRQAGDLLEVTGITLKGKAITA